MSISRIDARLADSRLELKRIDAKAPVAEGALEIDPDHIQLRCFAHQPPSGADLERAIELIEDALARLGWPLAKSATLMLTGDWPAVWRDHDSPCHWQAVESMFSDLSRVAEGQPASTIDWPTDGASVASVVLVRELMHHLGATQALMVDD